MFKESARTIQKYLSQCLVGICENEESLYKTVTDKESHETKHVINYSAIEIKPLPFIFDNEMDENLYSDFNDEVGKTILAGYKLYGQELIDAIGVINIRVYDQDNCLIDNVPFTLLLDIKTLSVALQEVTN